MRILLAVGVFCLVSGAGPVSGGELPLNAAGPSGRPAFSNPFALASRKLLDVSLIPEAPEVATGKPFSLVMRFRHAPGAYTYWTNPGGPGQGARISWDLPPGFTISAPAWPAPEKSENAGIVSYVYRDSVLVLFTATPPASLKAGDPVEIGAEIDIQVCTARTCAPEKITVAAAFRAAGGAGTATPLVAAAKDSLPVPVTGWDMRIEGGSGDPALVMTPGAGANPDPGGIYFFDAAEPEPLVDSQAPQRLEREGGEFRLTLPVRAAGGGRLSGVLRAENGWLAGEKGKAFSVSLPLPGTASARTAPERPKTVHDAAILLFFAFFGGLLLNVMPCVFPVISLKIMGFARQAHKDRRWIFLHGLAYTAGVLACFWALALLVTSLGRGWGAQLQSAFFVYALCHLFVILGLNMAGVFEVGAGAPAVGQSLSGRTGIKRSFLSGLLATAISTPCSAPFLGAALAYALSLPAHLALGVFTLMGLGFALPYLLFSLFPGWLRRLPKPGQWMETFRQAMSFPLFATAGYMLWTLEAMIGERRLLAAMFALVAAAFACWLHGKGQRAAHARARTRGRVFTAAAAVCLAAGVWMGWPSAESGPAWREWSPELARELRDAGKPVYVDFTARWCATCQVNKRVYGDPEVAGLIAEKGVVLLKADWTTYDDRITATLKNEFNKAAVPVTVLYAPGERNARLLPDLLTPGNVTEELRNLP